jgi:hypothetical protein
VGGGETDERSFEARVLAEFGYLISEFGFELTEVFDRGREDHAIFKSSTTEVCIFHAHFGLVTVHVSWPLGAGRMARHGLHLIVRDACPEHEASLPDEYTGEEVTLAVHARLLRIAAADLLVGDFSRHDRLNRVGAEEQRRRHQAEFGTSTGETPRFTERPTLPALFADAHNAGIQKARVVQAFWDYEYTLAQIGRFLEVDETTVQAALDSWFGL